jgi:hypothetical protein
MHDAIWMAIHPRRQGTRILATQGPGADLLQAVLRTRPAHPRALAWLLEALALWEGMPVRAALVADESAASCDTSLFHDSFDVFGTPLYELTCVSAALQSDGARLRDFRDLRRLLAREVAR